MADEYQLGSSGNWWDPSRNRLESGSTSSSSIPLNSSSNFQDSQKLQAPPPLDSSEAGLLADPNLQMIGLGLSSQGMDWNQALFRGEKAGSSYRSMLQEDLNTEFQQAARIGMASSQEQWREKNIYSGSSTEFKQINQSLSLDQQHCSSHISSGDSTSFHMDSAMCGSPSTMFRGLFLGSDNQEQQPNFEMKPMNYSYPSSYAINSNEFVPAWPRFPQFQTILPPKQPPHGSLHFSNNAPFWNTSSAPVNDVPSSFLPLLGTQFPATTLDEKLKNTSEVQELGSMRKKGTNELSNKRARNETPSSPLPAFKVRKEKMGDRITALQQLVSPFGKTDTASVLSEAIEFIKFLHQQVNVLSAPYIKSGGSIKHQENSDKSTEGPDLRSRGLCLVPVSSTYPVTHDTSTVDFWNPTFGGTFR